jgi:tripartite-type tricarboxylate transporter receptor subunit TctC
MKSDGSKRTESFRSVAQRRRDVLRLGLAAGALAASPAALRAQAAYPSRPVHVLLGFAAGGSSDVIGRLVCQWLSEHFSGRPFVFDDKPGAGSNIATEIVAKEAPDGYSLLWCTSANAINATLYQNLNFDFLRDFTPAAGVFRVPNVLEVHPSVPVKTVPEFIAYAKANPGKLNYASGGIGATQHMSAELFKFMTGIDMKHVPYRGSAPALIDLLSGQVQVMFDLLPASIGYIRAGKLRALAVTTAQKSEALPELPTIGEFVPGYEASTWNGVVAPEGTPADVIQKLNGAINAALADATIEARLADLGATAIRGSSAEFGKFLADEVGQGDQVRGHQGRLAAARCCAAIGPHYRRRNLAVRARTRLYWPRSRFAPQLTYQSRRFGNGCRRVPAPAESPAAARALDGGGGVW